MTIIKYLPQLPKEGQIIYADNGKNPNDRACFEDGVFIGGGEFPTQAYVMKKVTKWFCFNAYRKYQIDKGETCFKVSFTEAEVINDNNCI